MGLCKKKEYDFSKGVRGKFYNKEAKFHLPIYLELEIESFFLELSKKKNLNLTQMINALVLKDKETIELVNVKHYTD